MTRKFGKYRLLERLGGGGMAEVWRAEASFTEDVSKIVALKMIREDLSSQKQFHSLFIDEARITSRISHTNVAQVLDFGDEEGRPFLAIELVEGADLFSLMAAAGEQMRRIPLDVAAFVVAEVARGLDHAHRLSDKEGLPLNIVHRDVSPQNVLVSYAGEVKVTDFGIARARDKVTQTETGTVMGKFRYMSPEQVRGEDIDARSDIFSCGILLYELVTGKQLFDARTSAQVVDQIRYDELPELSASRPDVDPALDTVLRGTLERDLGKRCPDAATLARDLERYVHVAHPQFTRERVAELLESLMPRKVAQLAQETVKGSLAYAGTELAPNTGPEKKQTPKPEAPERATKSLADLEREDAAKPGPDAPYEPDTTAPAKRGAATKARAISTVVTGPIDNGVPSEAMEGLTDPPPPADSPDEPSHEETLTLARRASISASGPIPRDSAPHEAPTKMLDEAPDATGRTSARPPQPADEEPVVAASQTSTRTAGRARGQASPRATSRAGKKPRRKGRGMQATLGVVLALLLLGGVVLLFMQKNPAKTGTGGEPGASAMSTPHSNLDAAAGNAPSDATPLSTDGGADRIQQIDEAITALEPDKILANKRNQAWANLMLRLDRRLRFATVDDEGNRQFGVPCKAGALVDASPNTTAEKLADLYAERIMLDAKVAKPLWDALPNPGAKRGLEKAAFGKTAALRVMAHHPHNVYKFERALIYERAHEQDWCPPLAGRAGKRYLFPHLIVARDAVSLLLKHAPDNKEGLLWKRYLESAPRGESVKLGMVSLRITSTRKQVLKKDDNEIFFVTLQVNNTDPDSSVKLEAAGFKLHGVTTKPVVVGLWKPDMKASMAPGTSVTLELTFAAPIGSSGDTIVLSAPRVGAGSVWLQVSSTVMPSEKK